MTYSKIEKNNAVNFDIKVNDIKLRALLRAKLNDELANAEIISKIFDILAGKQAALYLAVEHFLQDPENCSEDDKCLFACAKLSISSIPLNAIPTARNMMHNEQSLLSKPVYEVKQESALISTKMDNIDLSIPARTSEKKLTRSLVPKETTK